MWLTMARPRPVPRPLVEKYGRNSFSLSSARDAAAGVGHQQLHRIGGGRAACATQQVLHQRILHGFGGVVHQVDHHALELLADRRSPAAGPAARSTLQIDAVQPPVETRPARCRTISFRSQGTGCAAGKRENCENSSASVFTDSTSREMVAAHSRRMRCDSGVVPAAIQLPRDALGAQRDGRQRILDLVRDAARHFVPGRGLLRAQQLAGIFEHHHETRSCGRLRRQRRNRDGQVQHLRAAIRHRSGWRRRRCGARASSGIGFRRRLRARNRSLSARRAPPAPRGNRPCSARFTRWMRPSALSEITPVGMLSRIASVKRRRLSSSRLLASSSCIISLKARTSVASSSIALTCTRWLRLPLRTSPAATSSAEIGDADLPRKQQRDPGGDEQNEQRDQQHEQQVQLADILLLRRQLAVFADVALDFASRVVARSIRGLHADSQHAAIAERRALASNSLPVVPRSWRAQICRSGAQLGNAIWFSRTVSRNRRSPRAPPACGDPVRQRLRAALHFLIERAPLCRTRSLRTPSAGRLNHLSTLRFRIT